MTDKRVIIVGGHGKIALLAAPKLAAAGYRVESLIRDPQQSDDVHRAEAEPVVLDIESADVDALAEAFAGADAVVFSAGAGGGNPQRTAAVDFDAATRTMDAALKAGVDRYVMVSYARAAVDIDNLEPGNSFYPYAKAKHDADEYLRGTDLDYTILGPGRLTLEPASGTIVLADETGEGIKQTLSADEKVTSRENVAEVITYVIAQNAAVNETVNFFDGDTAISDALA
ncbi:SDR family oxidoreductase [Paramicrobacterium agarici]|uniref:Nucleoside-diphosphate-sugar epimerase n=1 Tax=Paramicrobacterium agarici TaxID=630514 RepID=A0A2A9E0L6_9MICO|nr:SDR family oxidoreductase [Microbacterium agarici]PFG31720.1 nucleoside-diphosphate-sugar epimerase [Microbacterium agarici]